MREYWHRPECRDGRSLLTPPDLRDQVAGDTYDDDDQHQPAGAVEHPHEDAGEGVLREGLGGEKAQDDEPDGDDGDLEDETADGDLDPAAGFVRGHDSGFRRDANEG